TPPVACGARRRGSTRSPSVESSVQVSTSASVAARCRRLPTLAGATMLRRRARPIARLPREDPMSNAPGRFVWYELLTTDTRGAIAFYTEVIGWKSQPFDQSADPYTMWVSSQGPMGGVFPLPEEAKKMGAPPHWMAHVEVASVDATAAKAK